MIIDYMDKYYSVGHLDQDGRCCWGHILGDAQGVPGVQRPVHEDDIGHGNVTAAVLRHREVHAPLQEDGGELGPEHVRAHLHEEGEGEGVSEGVTWSRVSCLTS